MSIAQWLGLPEPFVVTLLVLVTVLALAPYFSGLALGNVEIPKLEPRRRRAMRFAGPFCISAGILLVVPFAALRPARANLRLLVAEVTESGDIDIVVTNTGSAAALLTAIELQVTGDRGIRSRPVLIPAATYSIPIDGLRSGDRRKRMVRHLIAAGGTERILISPQTSQAFNVRLRICADDGTVLTADLDLLTSTISADQR